MITWGVVWLNEILEELKPLVAAHHAELEDGTPTPDPDWESYKLAGEAGQAMAVTARNESGRLVGYVIFTISRNLRYKEVIEAVSSGWFVEKEYRNEIDMIEKAEEVMKDSGVNEVSFILNGAAGRLLQRKGFEVTHQVWSKKYGKFFQ